MRMAPLSPSLPRSPRAPRASGSASQFSICPISSSSSESDAPTASVSQRRASQWSSWSSSDDDDEEEELEEEERMWRENDEYEDFAAVQRMSQSAPASAAKLDRLRRIFLNMPPKESARRPSGERRRRTKTSTTVKARRSVGSSSTRSGVATRSNSSESEHERERMSGRAGVTLAIDQHVKALSDHVQRLARQHDAHAQQWQTKLSQAVDELKFIKQQEECTLQSHVQMLRQTYALRLEVFEQQYRAKVAEIRDEMQAEIALKRQQSEDAIVAATQRLQRETQQHVLLLPLEASDQPMQTPCATQAKTARFLERQHAREAIRSRHDKVPEPRTSTAHASPSPVARQRAKLRLLEEKLATFSPRTVERVVNAVECRSRQRKAAANEAETEPNGDNQKEQELRGQLKPTPLSPLRKRASYWRQGISWEERGGEGSKRASARLSRRFLRPEEEQELLMLRNSIGLAKDWMEQHHAQELQ